MTRINDLLAARMDRLRKGEREQGFTLIELLVVIIIIGILAAIAIPLFLNQRTSAWQASVKSDVHNAVLATETFGTANNGSYTGAGSTGDNSTGTAATKYSLGTSTTSFSVSAGNKIVVIVATSGNYYTVVGSNQNVGTTWFYVYNSASGSGATQTSAPTAAATS